MQTKHIALGAGIFSTHCWVNKSSLDTEYVAHTGSIRLNHAGMASAIEFNLGLQEAKDLIAALQQHIAHITQAQDRLANPNQKQAA